MLSEEDMFIHKKGEFPGVLLIAVIIKLFYNNHPVFAFFGDFVNVRLLAPQLTD